MRIWEHGKGGAEGEGPLRRINVRCWGPGPQQTFVWVQGWDLITAWDLFGDLGTSVVLRAKVRCCSKLARRVTGWDVFLELGP